MNNNLHKLKKTDLLNIISKMKKKELIQIIETKVGGSDAIRSAIIYNKNKLKQNQNQTIAMANDTLYNNVI